MLEWLIPIVVDNVSGYLLNQSGLGEHVRDRLKREPLKAALEHSLHQTFAYFERQHPQLAAEDLFNADFLEQEYAPFFSQFLLRDGCPSPVDLANLWAKTLYKGQPAKQRVALHQFEPAASDFISYLTDSLRSETALQALYDSRASDQTARATNAVARDISAIRASMEGNKLTPGTRQNYLHWLIERNLYLDPRGTYQTQRQVQVKLEEVFVSLKAQPEALATMADGKPLEGESESQFIRIRLHFDEMDAWGEQRLEVLTRPLLPGNARREEALELSAAVTRHNRLVILGDPGSGKTTLLRYLALKHAQALQRNRQEAGSGLGATRFPILVRIADYAEQGLPQGASLTEYLADYCSRYECPRARLADLLTGELEGGNCLVLLDGLDEIVSTDDRIAVVRQIEEFVRRHDDVSNRFVITSRIAGYSGTRLSGEFAHYTVREMDLLQIRRFLEVWCPAVEAAETPDLSAEARAATARREIEGIMHAVQNAPGVYRLATNPLLLRTLALIYRTGAQLPQRRIELYKLAADTLARTWRTAQGVPESALVDESYLTRLLGKLAYWLHANKPTGIASEQEVYRELGQEWARLKGLPWDEDNPEIEQEVRKFLRQVREHTGLFVERSPRHYGFMHLTFEEYYTARYLVSRGRTRAQLIRKHLHQPRWEEPILLALGFVGLNSADDAAELLETAVLALSEEARELELKPSRHEELLARDYLFALRCLGDSIPARLELGQQLAKRLFDELLFKRGAGSFERYQRALEEALGHLEKSKEASFLLIPHLLHILQGKYRPGRRQWAVYCLGRVGRTSNSDEVVRVLLAALREEDSWTHPAAVWSLGQVRPLPEIVEALIEKLNDSQSIALHQAAAESLGELQDASPQVIEALLHVLQSNTRYSFLVRDAAVRSLGQLGKASSAVVAALISLLPHDYLTTSSESVLKSLGRLSQNSPEMIPLIYQELQQATPRVRSAVTEALEKYGYTTSEEFARLKPPSDPSTATKPQASQSSRPAARTSQAERIAVLLQNLRDGRSWVRWKAVKDLGRSAQPLPEIEAALLHRLHDDHTDVGEEAALALARLGLLSQEVMVALFRMVSGARSSFTRRDSAQVLGQVGRGDEATQDALWHGLLDEDHDVRTACAEALAQLGRRFPLLQDLIEARLIQAINDPEFARLDNKRRSAHQYAYDGLWLLVVESEIGKSGAKTTRKESGTA